MKQKLLKGVACLVAMPFFILALNETENELLRSRHNAMMTTQRFPTRTLRRAQRISAEIFDNLSLGEDFDDSSASSGYETTLSEGNSSDGSHVVSTRRPAQDQKKEYVGR